MKKLIVLGLVFLFLVSVPGRGLAQTSELTAQDLRAQIQLLLEQIRQLQAQLSAAEGAGSVYVPPAVSIGPTVTVTPGQKFIVGESVQAVDYLNIRENPGGPATSVANPGYDGVIIGGSVQQGAYWWWQVKWSKGNSGWSVEDWMDKKDTAGSGLSAEFSKSPYFAVDSFVSPTSVGAGHSNWWRVKGHDPEGGTLVYLVSWGDGTSNTYNLLSGGDIAATHVYKNGGTYKIEAKVTDISGFTASRFLTVDVIDANAVLSQPSVKFKVGDSVITTDNLNVRTGPSGVHIGIQLPNARGTITGGPVWSILGRWWWAVNYDTGEDGWSAEDWLTKTSKDETVLPKVSAGDCGDIDGNGVIDQNDLDNPSSTTDITDYVFGGVPIPTGLKVDLNGDGRPDILDVTTLVNYLNRGGPAPTCDNKLLTKTSLGLAVGDRVQAKEAFPLRKTPDGDISTTIAVGTKGTVAGLSSLSGDSWSASIHWDNRYKGYAAEDFITKIAPVSVSGVCGDLNGDGVVNVVDVTLIQLYTLQSTQIPTGVNADVNGDGKVDILDKTLIDDYALRGGPAPTCEAGSSGGGVNTGATPSASVIQSFSTQLSQISQQLQQLLQVLR
ncbi:MAG: hypothetical protein G01um101420_114 [Parcubacteria group bacterium Gr01-1014_20]|nr:MAG: hypothetical protein G01um101420_114 [Parcubacteria group bacterium Gr01-1014_20]